MDAWAHGRTNAQTHERTDATTRGRKATRTNGRDRARAKAAARYLSAANASPERSAALRLLAAPLPIRVRLGRSGLESFREGETWHDVSGWSGPERLAPRWWKPDGSARDYFVVRDGTGALWLLFRARRTWFVEGWWD